MRLAMHDPLAAILTQTGLCVEKSQGGHGELVTDLGKILSAAQNLEKLSKAKATPRS